HTLSLHDALPIYSDAARAPPQTRPERAAFGRPALGVVDRRPDDHRPDAARTADGEADPLDAEHAGPRAADEGDPTQVQGRPPEAQRRADEVLQGEQHQSGGLVPAARRPVADLHRPLLHAAALRQAPPAGQPLVAALRAQHRAARERALVGLDPDRDLRAQSVRLDVLHVRDDAAVAAGAD